MYDMIARVCRVVMDGCVIVSYKYEPVHVSVFRLNGGPL